MSSQSNKRLDRAAKPRPIIRLSIFVLIVVGVVFGLGLGTPSSFGWEWISTICPLGALEAMLGSWSFAPRLIITLAIMGVAAFFLGRSFCSWACPVPPVSNFFKSKKQKDAEKQERIEAGTKAADAYANGSSDEAGKRKIDSRHVVLAGALGSAAVFGFPVFCLVCPIGLTIATIITLVRFLGFNDATWGLLLFPTILIIELVVMKKWCVKICPVGALLSLVSSFSKSFKPHVDTAKCLRSTTGERCGVCAMSCPELIDPHSNLGLLPTSECTHCHICIEQCPAGALSFPFLPPAETNASEKKAAQ